jgi:hypothetical protein
MFIVRNSSECWLTMKINLSGGLLVGGLVVGGLVVVGGGWWGVCKYGY